MLIHHNAVIGWKPYSDNPNVASARLRCRSPLALLRNKGFPVELYQEEHLPQYRVVILQKLYDTEHQELAKRLKAQGTRVVFDLCDNYLYTADRQPDLMLRAEQVRRMLDIADVVTASTEALAQHLPCPTHVIRDGVDSSPLWGFLGPLLQNHRQHRQLELIWFGLWGNPHVAFGMRDLLCIRDILQELASRTSMRLTVVSNSHQVYNDCIAPLPFPSRYVEWQSHQHLCRMLPWHDACLIPIQPNPYTLCKSPNRLTLCLYLGVPVIGTSIPSYKEFDSFCSLDDWDKGLRTIEVGGDAWRIQSESGRRYIRENHMMEHAALEWKSLLIELLSE